MMTRYRKLFLILMLVSFLSLVGQICVLPVLPDQIPIHWNAAGEIDSYGSKWMALLFGALPLLMLGLFRILPRIDPKWQNYEKHMEVYVLCSILFVVLFIAVSWIVILTALEVAVPVERLLPGMLGALFIVLGNYMPRIRHNYTFGIRTSWTLASETVWKKTHRAGGFCFMGFGLVMILHAVFPTVWLAAVSMAGMIGSVIFLTVYSWAVWKKEQEK